MGYVYVASCKMNNILIYQMLCLDCEMLCTEHSAPHISQVNYLFAFLASTFNIDYYGCIGIKF